MNDLLIKNLIFTNHALIRIKQRFHWNHLSDIEVQQKIRNLMKNKLEILTINKIIYYKIQEPNFYLIITEEDYILKTVTQISDWNLYYKFN